MSEGRLPPRAGAPPLGGAPRGSRTRGVGLGLAAVSRERDVGDRLHSAPPPHPAQISTRRLHTRRRSRLTGAAGHGRTSRPVPSGPPPHPSSRAPGAVETPPAATVEVGSLQPWGDQVRSRASAEGPPRGPLVSGPPTRRVPVAPLLHAAQQPRLGPGDDVGHPTRERLCAPGAHVPPRGVATGHLPHRPRSAVEILPVLAQITQEESGRGAAFFAAAVGSGHGPILATAARARVVARPPTRSAR